MNALWSDVYEWDSERRAKHIDYVKYYFGMRMHLVDTTYLVRTAYIILCSYVTHDVFLLYDKSECPTIAPPTATNTFPNSATLAAPPVLVSLAAEPVLLALPLVVELLVEDAPESAVVAAPVVKEAVPPALASEVCFELVLVSVAVSKPSATADAGRV
jgi:hypothetical protein